MVRLTIRGGGRYKEGVRVVVVVVLVVVLVVVVVLQRDGKCRKQRLIMMRPQSPLFHGDKTRNRATTRSVPLIASVLETKICIICLFPASSNQRCNHFLACISSHQSWLQSISAFRNQTCHKLFSRSMVIKLPRTEDEHISRQGIIRGKFTQEFSGTSISKGAISLMWHNCRKKYDPILFVVCSF